MADIIFSKAWGTGSDVKKGRVREIRKPFCRKTNLPANWKRVRIGMMLSFTNTTDNNGALVTEASQDAGPSCHFWFGLTSAPGNPWDSGVNFVGARSYGYNIPLTLHMDKLGRWSLNCHGYSDPYLWMREAKSVSGTVSTGRYRIDEALGRNGTPDPTLATGHCWPFVFDIICADSGQMRIINGTGFNSWTDPTMLSLNTAMTNPAPFYELTQGTAVYGWWDNTDEFVDCPYLYFYFPFLNNRPIIYGLQVMQLA